MLTPDLWTSAGVALAIGLLVGAERERSKHSEGSNGVRTFTITALLGNVAVILPTVASGVLLAAAAVIVCLEYAVNGNGRTGITSEVALLATLALGALTRSEPALAVGVAVAMVVLLSSRQSLHRFIRDTVTDLERTDALKLFVAAFVVLPLLPTGHFGPYGVWVPQRIWLLVVMVTSIGWVGYAATRVLGASRGLLLAGLAGGFVSGTATTGALGAKVKDGTAPFRAGVAGALMASASTLVQLGAVTMVVDDRVTRRLIASIIAGTSVLTVEAWLLSLRQLADNTRGRTSVGRPFALTPALILAGVISAVLLLATWMSHRYGASGTTVATGVGAVADVHAAAVAVASLAHAGNVSVHVATQAILVGVLANTAGKLVAALVGGGARFAGAVLLGFAPAAAAITVAVVLST